MDQYVYIRYESDQWGMLSKWFSKNKNWDRLIKCIANRNFAESINIPVKKVHRLILKEANELINGKLLEYEHNNRFIFKTNVSLKQISRLRNPKNGHTTCHAGVILMAIYNLLYDESDCQFLRNLRTEMIKKLVEIDLQTYALGEQYTEIKNKYVNCQFNCMTDHQKQLVAYYLGCIDNISKHNNHQNLNDIISNFKKYGKMSEKDIIDLKAYKI